MWLFETRQLKINCNSINNAISSIGSISNVNSSSNVLVVAVVVRVAVVVARRLMEVVVESIGTIINNKKSNLKNYFSTSMFFLWTMFGSNLPCIARDIVLVL